MVEQTHTKHGIENTVYTVMDMGMERNDAGVSKVYGTKETKSNCLFAQLMALGIGQNGNAEL